MDPLAENNPFLSLPKTSNSPSAPAPQEGEDSGDLSKNNPFLSLPKKATQQQAGSQQQGAAPSQQQDLHVNNLTGETVDFNNPWATKEQTTMGQTFNDKLDIFNRGFERYALGGLQKLNNIPILDKVLPSDEQLTQQQVTSEANYQQAYKRTPSPFTSLIGEIGGATIAGAPAVMATTTAGPMTLLNAVGQGAASGFMSGATDYSDSAKESLYKGFTSGILGAATTAVAGVIGSILREFTPEIGVSSYIKKLWNPKGAATEDLAHATMLDNANNPTAALSALDDVQKPGVPKNLTPGEAMGAGQSQVGKVRQMEGGIALNEADKLPISQNLIPKVNEVKQKIYNTIDNMTTPETQATKDNAFKAMESQYIGPKGEFLPEAPASTNYVPDVIKSNKLLSEKYDEVINSTAPEFSGMPNGSVAQLHKVEQLIKEDLYKSQPNPITGQITKDLSATQKAELLNAKKQLRPILEQSSAYNEAMVASKKIKTQEYYQELLGKAKPKAGMQGDLTLEQTMDKISPQDLLSNKFLNDVTKTGGDPQQAAELLKVADSLRKAPLWDVLKNSKTDALKYKGRELGIVQEFIAKMTLNRYYKALLDVTMSGTNKWAPEIANVIKQKAGSEAQHFRFLQLLNKAMKVTAPKILDAAGVQAGRAVAPLLAGSPDKQKQQKLNYGVSNN